MAVIGSLSVKLGLVTVEWDKATAQAKKQAKDLQAAFNDLGINLKGLQGLFQQLGGAAGLSTAGILAMSHAVLDLAGQVNDLAKTYDVSIAKVLQFQDALIQAGGKSEDAGKIMATMFAKISEAQQGNEAAIATFEDLGITFEQLRAMSPEKALTEVYKGLAAIGNTYDRIKLTKELLGKSGLHKSVEEIAEALGKSTKEFKQQAEAIKSWSALGDRLDKMMLNLKLAFADFFKVFTGGDFVPSANQFKAAMVAITAVATINGMFKLVAAFRALNVALKSTAALGVAISATGGIKGIAMAGAGLAAYFGAIKAFEGGDEGEGEGGGQEGGGTPTATQTGDRREITAAQAKINLMKQLMGINKERNAAQIMYLQGSQHELQLTESALKQQEEIATAQNERAQAFKKENLSAAQRGLIEDEYNTKINKANQEREQRDKLINAQRDLAIKMYEQESTFIEQRNALEEKSVAFANEQYKLNQWQIAQRNEALSLEKKLLDIQQQKQIAQETLSKGSPEYNNAMKRYDDQIAAEQKLSEIRQQGIIQDQYRAQSFSAGWEEAFRKFSQDADNFGKVGADSFNSLVGSMNSAIDNFVRTGKFSFKDFTLSIIRNLISIQMQSQAMSIFKGSGIGNLFKSTPSGAVNVGTVTGGDMMMAFADGGEPPVGRPSLVGENGPELFIPKSAGTIIPNNRLSSSMGGGSQVVYNGPYIANMSAIDTQSGLQFLARNKQAVWAANQSAQRSLPVSK